MFSNPEFLTIQKWFKEYTHSFRSSDRDFDSAMRLKEVHSFRVAKEIDAIGKSLQLDPQSMKLAHIMSLLHDIGRFEQYKRFNTFVDSRSVNHAALGVEILGKQGILDLLMPDERAIVLTSISFHNRASIPEHGSEQIVNFAKMLRDADKLDIWNIVCKYYNTVDRVKSEAIELNLPDTDEISTEICDALIERRIASVNALKTFNDFKLLQIGWVYDLNFRHSLQCVKNRKYMQDIFKALPHTPVVNEIYSTVCFYIDKQLEAMPENTVTNPK